MKWMVEGDGRRVFMGVQYNHIKAKKRVKERQSRSHCKTAILVKEANDNKRTTVEEVGGQQRRSISMIDIACLARPSPP